MIEYLKRMFCRHGAMEVITDMEWVNQGACCGSVCQEQRKYMICKKCGYKRKISNR